MNANAQTSEEAAVKQVIIDFFDAFHQKDTAALRTMALPETPMQTITKNKEGQDVLVKSTYDTFLERMATMPTDLEFKEEIKGYDIRIDGAMANAWTPYTFWVNGEVSHCGVNSFQLMKHNGSWKIFFVVDTRRKNCE
ncbi:nuclear transport factor 2 family protein [Robertkochia sp. 1368]|nr:nuclear transport factor 2 family protein [Robertkochia sediminum]